MANNGSDKLGVEIDKLVRRSSFKKFRATLRRSMNFHGRHRSNSDIGAYSYNWKNVDAETRISLMQASFCAETPPSKSYLAAPELLARQMLALSCPAVVTVKVELCDDTNACSEPQCDSNASDSCSCQAESLMPSRPRGGPGAPRVVEDPPSSDASDNDGSIVKYSRGHTPDPALHNGSSSSFSGSAGPGARSAPSTPFSISLQPPGTSDPCYSQSSSISSCSNQSNLTSISRSPSHTFAKYDKSSIKQLSSSTPAMTGQLRPPELQKKDKEGETSKEKVKQPGSSKARQKKFHRHFDQVPAEERVLNYYSCALVGDILLQGHLYITKNYFAFYSNVFGYVTKLLIPALSVVQINKEKMARIIPNAVGIVTNDDKHVFGSLLSRESTFKLMTTVWKSAQLTHSVEIIPIAKELQVADVEASECSIEEDSSSQSGNESPSSPSDHRHITSSPIKEALLEEISIKPELQSQKTIIVTTKKPINKSSVKRSPAERIFERFRENVITISQMPRHNLLMLVSTFLLLLLFLSAGLLLYRIGRIQNRYSSGIQDNLVVLSKGDNVYNEILRWQAQLHSKSANEIHSFLSANLDQIAKVRQSLEALSLLITPLDEDRLDEKTNNKVLPIMQEQASLANQDQTQTNS